MPRAGAIWSYFFVSGAALGTWSAAIPAVRERLALSPAAMSGLILLMGLVTVASGLFAGQLLSRLTSAAMVRVGALLTPIAAALALAVTSPAALALALVAFGASYALLDVSMNAHGVAIELHTGGAVMSSLHGGWSIGAMAGAGAVALGHLLGLPYQLEAAVAMGALLLLGGCLGGRLDPWAPGGGGAPQRPGTRLALPTGAVVLIGLLALVLYTVEGVALDWSGLYVVQDTAGSAALAAAAVAAFSAGMTVGRLIGDRAKRLLGPSTLLQIGMATAAVALLVQVALGLSLLAVPTLFLTGVGAANSAPLLLSAAGRSGDMLPGAAIAATTTMGDMGLLFVSPLLGAAAQVTSFSLTLACAGTFAAIGAIATRRVFAESPKTLR